MTLILDYLKSNLLSIVAILISLAGFALSFKNYLKSNIELKISSYNNNNICVGFIWINEYRLIIIDVLIENNSSTDVNISRIRLVDDNHNYLANPISIKDMKNSNGITLIKNTHDEYIRYNISSENIMNNCRISSYGTARGFAVFNDVDLISSPKNFTLIVDTPYKSFNTNVIVNLCPNEFCPLQPLE